LSEIRTAIEAGGDKVVLGSMALQRPHVMAAKQTSKGAWVLTSQDARLRVSPDAWLAGDVSAWSVDVTLSAYGLAVRSWSGAVAYVRDLVQSIGHVHGMRAVRLEMAADFEGFALNPLDYVSVVSGARTTTGRAYARQSSGFEVGRRDNGLLLRVYDKTLESKHEPNAAKHAADVEQWERNGWEGGNVVRVEFELGRKRKLEGLGLTCSSWDDLAAWSDRFGGVWAYLTQKWVRLVDLSSATRSERAKMSERWRAVQAVDWASPAQPVKRKRFEGSGASMRQAAGTLISAMVWEQDTPPTFHPGVFMMRATHALIDGGMTAEGIERRWRLGKAKVAQHLEVVEVASERMNVELRHELIRAAGFEVAA